jgi:nitrate/nitrite-specific signal transduction histidine kinase
METRMEQITQHLDRIDEHLAILQKFWEWCVVAIVSALAGVLAASLLFLVLYLIQSLIFGF